MRSQTILCFLCLLIACSNDNESRIDFMVGTWKVEGKEQYEVWEKTKGTELIGYSYKIIDDQKTITETLSIKKVENNIVYEATVPDQNEGRTVPFTINNRVTAFLSFENLKHDFPKKIQYRKISDDEIEVTVVGEEGKGFSYTQSKQKVK